MGRLTERLDVARRALGTLDEIARKSTWTPVERAALLMVQDRNLTVHTYDERLTNDVAARIPDHAHVLHTWVDAMTARSSACRRRSTRPPGMFRSG